ncbi:MAG: VCBS repeat-containing protein, partial [Planctomycetales bacterium]
PFGSFNGGIFVAAGDVTGDGVDDIITSADQGAVSDIRVYNGTDSSLVRRIVPFANYLGGVRVAASDVNQDGFVDVIAGSGPGAVTDVRVFDLTIPAPELFPIIDRVVPFSPFTGGVFVAGAGVPDGMPLTAAVGDTATSDDTAPLSDADALRLVDAAIDRLAAGGIRRLGSRRLARLGGRSRRLTRRDPGVGFGGSHLVGRGCCGTRLVYRRHALLG